MIFLQLFWTFLIIGILTFGGGYAMVALIEHEMVDNHAWLTAQEFTDILAVSQMTPGPIGINTATYAGYTAVVNAGYPIWMGVCGSLTASLAVILLPVALVMLLSHWLMTHRSNPMVASVLRIMRLAVIGLIAAAALGLLTADSFGLPGLNLQFIVSTVIFLGVFIAAWRYKVSPILLIVISGIVGLVVYSLA